MLHEYLTEASLKSLCPRKEAVEKQLGGGMKAKMERAWEIQNNGTRWIVNEN